jgi:hypothetical protein
MIFFKRKHHHKQFYPARAVTLVVNSIIIHLQGNNLQVNLTWTTPSTRIDGTPLALTDIASTNVSRNGTIIGSPIAVVGAMAFTDSTPLTGSDVYTVDTVTTDGLVSADSNAVTITVPAANPASAITDLAGVLITP